MTVKFLSVLLLLAVALSDETKTETGHHCLQGNFQNFSHCVSKREASHYWCTAKGCDKCLGRDCQASCKGFACGICPNGECCDSKNCNACYNSNCCSTPSCNYCIHACQHACSSERFCQSTCFQQCKNSTNDVFVVALQSQGGGHNDVIVYIAGVPHTGYVASGQVLAANKSAFISIDGVERLATILTLPTDSEKHVEPTHQPKVVHSQTSNNWVGRFNVTTVINITNFVNNSNEVESPVYVNHTNVNNVTYTEAGKNVVHQGNYSQLQQGCCYVVHPQQCYSDPRYRYPHCFRRSHQECSSLCSSRFIHLVPQRTGESECHYIRSYPYVYCGMYSVENCDPCYVCNEQYNPYFCVQQSNCSEVCRQTFHPPQRVSIQEQSPPEKVRQIQPLEFNPPQRVNRIVYPGSPEYQHLLGLLHKGQLMGRPVRHG